MTVPVRRDETDAGRSLTALGVAWNIFKLYPNPVSQGPFRQAVATLGDIAANGPVTFEVGTGTLLSGGEEVKASRGGADKLAVQLFVHEVDVLKIGAPPNPEELCELFRLLGMEDGVVRADGGIERALRAAGITSLTVRQKGLLGDDVEEDGPGDPNGWDQEEGEGEGGDSQDFRSKIAALIDRGATPEEVAQELMNRTDGDPAAIAGEFLEAFREIHDDNDQADQDQQSQTRIQDLATMFAPYLSPPSPAAPIGTFVEAFFVLPPDAQVEILRTFLENRGDGNHRIFLDQFSGSELAEFAMALDHTAFAALSDYVRDVADVATGATEDLLPFLHSASQVKEGRMAAADWVATHLQQLEETLARPEAEVLAELQADLAEDGWQYVGYETLRGLFECEDRPYRFLRLVRIWAGRIGAHIRNGEFVEARALVDAIRHDPPYQKHQGQLVDDGLGRLVTRELLERVVEGYTEKQEADDAVALLLALGPAVPNRLIEHLAAEQNGTVRRILIDILAELARTDQKPIIEHLRDPRWFVVRNLAAALGKSGRPQAAAPLRGLLSHDDHRVRVEAMRALARVAPDGLSPLMLAAMRDPHPRVREAALLLLRNSTSTELEATVAEAIENTAMGDAEAQALIDMLAERDTPAAADALEKLASSGFSLNSARRAFRQAARSALRKKAS